MKRASYQVKTLIHNGDVKAKQNIPMSQSLWQIGRPDCKCAFFLYVFFPSAEVSSLSRSQPVIWNLSFGWTRYKIKLTAHNWQNWKSRFLTCPCHNIYKEKEAIGLKSSNYTLEIMIFVNIWNFGQFRGNLIFCL